MYIVYGIKNCNTVKKSLDYLSQHKVAYTFYDYKKEGITKKKLTDWVKQTGWEALINKKGTTWRILKDEDKTSVTNAPAAIALAQEKTSVIKRPLIEKDGKVITLGFDQVAYDNIDW